MMVSSKRGRSRSRSARGRPRLSLLEIIVGAASLSLCLKSLKKHSCLGETFRAIQFPENHSKSSQSVKTETLLDPRVEEQVIDLIKNPRGPSHIHMIPPTSMFTHNLLEIMYQFTPGNRSQKYLLAASLSKMTARMALLAARHGKTFSLEHPRDSALFHMPDLIKVQSLPKVFAVLVDQCMYGLQEPAGAPRKIRAPMKIITNCLALRALGRVCDNSHDHYYTQKGRPANIPPPALIDSWISLLLETVDERPKTLFELDPWRETLKVSIPAGKRNRDLGTKPDYIIHRQFRSARAAAAAGIQMKKGALPPLLSREVEPGRAVDQISRARFPFDDLESLSPDLTKCVQRIARDGIAATVAFRAKELRHWEGRAKDLRLRSLRELDKAPESIKAVLLRGRAIGQFFHIALYREMLKSIDYPDQKYADRLMTGLPIAGPIETSNIWPADLIAASSTIREFENKAWEYREKLEKDPRYDHRIYDRPQEKGGPISYTNQIWESTIEETKDQEKAEDKVGTFMEGPYEAKDVSKILKT